MPTYEEVIEKMFAALPMFQRIGGAAYRADLSGIIQLTDILKQPQKRFKSVHIAGTNGKGSVSHTLSAILQAAGYKTGLYTSPHLKDFRERIRINGQMIPQKEVIRFYENITVEHLQPSFFEMTTALAFNFFAEEKVDIAVIETGMGGRLDSTNLITPELSIITNISLDHTQFLGTTLEAIAEEKAGIIKYGVPVAAGETQKETEQIFIRKAIEKNASIVFSDKEYKVERIDNNHFNILRNGKIHIQDITTDISVTSYQLKNFATIFCAAELLSEKFKQINEQAIRDGFASIVKTTGFQGRWQKIAEKPLTIADTGHNEGGIKLTLEQIAATPHKNLHVVWGMVGDKDITRILDLLPESAQYYFCCPPLPRGLNEHQLREKASEYRLKGQAYPSVRQALEAANRAAAGDDLIYVGGSNFVVAEVL
ncbi:MAG: bifunctional folylpolyglutamate synthase/dihydrofolate synthase [Bacteroidales bacterium]|jgi:dihydrofolate synthase/folylpolyglutamate synthase|nr:bifunctional folylpolyglutamate synthase/dihydrofolate synthase [Bacteroidales bacterium]